LNCPRCSGTLSQVMVSLCRAHTCQACGGAWVPFESCEAVMPRLAELAPEGTPAPLAAAPAKVKCPGCGGDLVPVKAHASGGITVRTCMVCFGRWVDGSELLRTRGQGLLGMIKAMFRRMAPKDKAPKNAPAPGEAEPAAHLRSEESARTETPGQSPTQE